MRLIKMKVQINVFSKIANRWRHCTPAVLLAKARFWRRYQNQSHVANFLNWFIGNVGKSSIAAFIWCMMYHVRIYVNRKWSYGSSNMCRVEIIKLRKPPSKFKLLFVMFHEIYLTYHGHILLEFGILKDNGILKTVC